MIAGFDFTFGKFGKGNMTVLQESKAFNTTIVGKQEMDSEKFLQLQYAKRLQMVIYRRQMTVGYIYRIKGTVVQGEKRGRTIGFPTANVQPSDDYVLPKRCLRGEYGNWS